MEQRHECNGTTGPRLLLCRRCAGEVLCLSTETVDRLVESGRLRCVRQGRSVRFLWRELEAYLQLLVNERDATERRFSARVVTKRRGARRVSARAKAA